MTFSLPIVLDAIAKASVILVVTALVAASLRRASPAGSPAAWLPPSGGRNLPPTVPPEGGNYKIGRAPAAPVDLPGAPLAISWTSLALLAWLAGATLVLGRMLLGLAAVQWLSRR